MDYLGKKVLITGHTGFKGSWLTIWLQKMGAVVDGLSLPGNVSEPNLYKVANVSVNKDIRLDLGEQRYWSSDFFDCYDVVFHLAAQPIVSEGYSKPLETFYANTVGTMNLLEGIRQRKRSLPVVVVTTDKVYKPSHNSREETDALGGVDVYSASKAAVELMVMAYRSSFNMQIATARAGNCIGGGDWGVNRLFPDMMRAFHAGERLLLRSPESVRPWQHVLEPLSGYLRLGDQVGAWNFGPKQLDERTVEAVVKYARHCWGATQPPILKHPEFWERDILQISSEKATKVGWKQKWSVEKAIEQTVAWYRAYYSGLLAVRKWCEADIEEYEA